MLPARGGTDFQVGGEVVTPLVLWKVGLSRGVPRSEADVPNPLGEKDLLAVVVGVEKSLVTLVILAPWAFGGARAAKGAVYAGGWRWGEREAEVSGESDR
eukprot:6957490-Prymnesium_polylepis.1